MHYYRKLNLEKISKKDHNYHILNYIQQRTFWKFHYFQAELIYLCIVMTLID